MANAKDTIYQEFRNRPLHETSATKETFEELPEPEEDEKEAADMVFMNLGASEVESTRVGEDIEVEYDYSDPKSGTVLDLD